MLRTRRSRGRLVTSALVCTSIVVATASIAGGNASAAVQRIELRVLVLDDGSPWVQAIESQLNVEGVPTTSFDLNAPGRAAIVASTLASTDHAFYQAVVAPSAVSGSLSTAEWTTVRAFEAQFSIREVDGFNWPESGVGLAPPIWTGDLAGVTATITPAATRDGFQYLSGPVPFDVGSYAYLATPLSSTTFTPLLTAVAPGTSTSTSILGVYAQGGLEQMIITAAMAFGFAQFKTIGHGIVSWMTRGVHLGYDRNYLTFHVGDAFASDALWDPAHNCTPGEDCPLGPDGTSLYPESSVRMTADDVAYAVAWQAANNYTFTLAFNGNGIAAGDALTTAFQTNRSSFRWLNHGLVHIYQGCVQDFSVVPWRCATDANGVVQWVPQADIQSEISANITAGRSIGLTFDTREYLSGEHSGLAQAPQQPVDNPNFTAAVAASRLVAIGADASRGSASRIVGGAITVPRHPTALFYNTASATSAVDEYNWLYTSRAIGGSGYCDDNPATATCIAPLDPATGFAGYIVPTNAAYDLSFVLSNDPRPFYAHTSNMSGDRLLYPLAQAILNRYRTSFAPSAPVVNLTLTQSATVLQRQARWSAASANPATVTAYLEGSTVTIANPTGLAVPITAPNGTTVTGTELQTYGGELSGWTTALAPIATLPSAVAATRTPTITSAASTTLLSGVPFSFTVTTTGTPTPAVRITGTLPTGLAWLDNGDGTATISGTTTFTTASTRRLTVTATNTAGSVSRTLSLVGSTPPRFTTAATRTMRVARSGSFVIGTTATPRAVLTLTGALPRGLTFRDRGDGTAVVFGTPAAGTAGSWTLRVAATNAAGASTQTLTLVVLP